MTSDAKIGLLLGLVFIFIIAFIINGLPGFSNTDDGNELTASLTDMDNDSMGLTMNERRAVKITQQVNPVNTFASAESVEKQNLIRFETDLPRIVVTVPEPSPSVKQLIEVAKPEAVKTVAVSVAPQVKRARPKLYVVQSGDSLAKIALKFYGSKEGNRKFNIDAIFAANSKQLKSPDKIALGQKLIIPAIRNGGVLDSAKFERVESVGAKKILPKVKASGKTRDYVVKDGDSLWRIAAAQLGSGARYGDISRLNTDVLSDEDSVVVGMTLKLPVR